MAPSKEAIEASYKNRPPNFCLCAKNSVLIGIGLSTVFGFVSRFDQAKDNFRLVHELAPSVPIPCALAAPGITDLAVGTGRFMPNPVDPWPQQEPLSSDLQIELCGATSPYDFLANDALKNASVVSIPDAKADPADPDTWVDAEASVVEALCGDGFDTGHQKFGDVRVRIARTYLGAQAAFVKAVTGCPWLHDPFHPDYCSASATIKEHLVAGAIGATGAGELPDTGIALYRLYALAILAFEDRERNNDLCLGNSEKLNASELCFSVFQDRADGLDYDGDSVADWSSTVSPPPAPFLAGLPEYEAIARTQQTCSGASTLLRDPPAPPPAPDYVYTSDGRTQHSEVETCSNTLEWGLLDQRRLYGIPDPRGPFQWDTTWSSALAGLLYNPAGLSNMDSASGEAQLDRGAELRLYTAYRLASATLMGTLCNLVVGWFLGYATIPMGVFLLTRFLNRKSIVTGEQMTLIRPPPGYPFLIFIFLGYLASSWALFVDPNRHMSPYYVVGACADWSKSDSHAPYFSSDAQTSANDRWRGWALVLLPTYALFYSLYLRGFGNLVRREARRQVRLVNARPSLTTLVIVPAVLILVFQAMQAADSGKAWFRVAVKQLVKLPLDEVEAKNLTKDCTCVVISAIFIGFALGATTQRWAVTQQELIIFKVPYMAVILFSVWFPFIQNSALLATANDAASSESTRQWNWTACLICQIATTVCVVFLFRGFLDIPGGSGASAQLVPDKDSPEGRKVVSKVTDDPDTWEARRDFYALEKRVPGAGAVRLDRVRVLGALGELGEPLGGDQLPLLGLRRNAGV